MYILDGICCAGQIRDDIKVTNVKPLQGRMYLLPSLQGKNDYLIPPPYKVLRFIHSKMKKIYKPTSIPWDNYME